MRKCLSLALGISLCFSASRFALGAETFRVMSYNVENLWDDDSANTPNAWRKFLDSLPFEDRDRLETQSLQYDDYSLESSNWYEPEILDAKIQHFIDVVKLAHEPEILVLQEIESAANESKVFAMQGRHLVLRTEFEKLGYKYFLLGEQDKKNPTAVTQAVISKLPLTALSTVNIDFPDSPYSTSARDIQVVEYKTGNNRMLIFNNHWKSKGGGRKTEITRIKTAEILKQRIAEEQKANPYTRVIVTGDLNSAYYEKPILVLASGDEGLMLKDKTNTLYNTWYEVPEEERWETSFRGERQTLSALLISDEFYLKKGIQYVDQSFHVLGHSGEASERLLNADGTPFRWQIHKSRGFSTHFGEGYSDHLPLIASFKIENSQIENPKSKITLTHKTETQAPSRKPKLDKVKICKEEDSIDVQKVDFRGNWFHQCVKVEGDFPLQGTHNEDNNFIRLQNGRELSLAMTRLWDGRPNVDDSRVHSAHYREFFRKFGDPRSNKCFHLKVLHGHGGVLKKAVGRLGFNEGRIAIFISSREEKNLILSNLPEKKRLACPWN